MSPDNTQKLPEKRCGKCGCLLKDPPSSYLFEQVCEACFQRKLHDVAERGRGAAKSHSTLDGKKCTRCGKHKVASEFNKNSSFSDGFNRYCRECTNGILRKYRQTQYGKEMSRIRSNEYRAKKRRSGGTYSPNDLVSIRAAQTDKQGRLICWKCGKPIKGTPHLDHWIPLAKGGANSAGNLHYMHAKCNISKHAKHPTEIGRLI